MARKKTISRKKTPIKKVSRKKKASIKPPKSNSKTKSAKPKVSELMRADLESSGIDESTQRKLKVVPLSLEQLNDNYKVPKNVIGGYEFQYLHPGTGLLLMKRAKVFYDKDKIAKKSAFYKDDTKKKSKDDSPKYLQGEGPGASVYFPPVLKWADILVNTQRHLYITEGEKKSAKMCQEGFPCIGLGGVWSFKVAKFEKRLLEDFQWIQWEGREVTIIFDSDAHEKEGVRHARIELTERLIELGAQVNIGIIPTSRRDKMGIDDFLKKHGKKAIDMLHIEKHDECEQLHEFNSEIAVISDINAVYLIEQNQIKKVHDCRELTFSNRTYEDMNPKTGKVEEKPLFDRWLKWGHRRQHDKLVCRPEGPRITEEGYLNSWSGWGIEPAKGCVKQFTRIVDNIFADEPYLKKWFMQWLACPLQNPGIKLQHNFLIWSPEQGVGKSLIGELMQLIYGYDHSSMITQSVLNDNNTDWLMNSQFVFANEIESKRHSSIYGKLKTLMTQPRIRLIQKYLKSYEIDNIANFYFDSNHGDAVYMEKNDRRLCVQRACQRTPYEKLRECKTWMHDRGAPAVFHHLLNEVSLEGYDPFAMAPTSRAKQDMVHTASSEVVQWVNWLIDEPDSVLVSGDIDIKRDIFTLAEAMSIYDPQSDRGTSPNAMGRALANAGVRNRISRIKGKTCRLYYLRNSDKWMKATNKAVESHYLGVVEKVRSKVTKFRPNSRGIINR